MARLTIELIKPVPVAPLTATVTTHPARSTSRVTIDLHAEDILVARGHALLIRGLALTLPTGVPGWAPDRLQPPPEACRAPLQIPGMPTGVSFYATAMEHRVAEGDSAQAGPKAA